MRYIISHLLLIFICSSVHAQTIVTGKLLDEQQKPVHNVSVSYKKAGSTALSGFTKTDQQGKFELVVKLVGADSLQLDFNHMAYAKKSVTVVNATANYAFVLQQQARQIEEVKVGNIPIYKRKDTINYDVNKFTSAQDRVIADIIKKLPGIEMRGDQILYQGKPIQKYMVNNLDLMEGRYGMINNNLPADAVKNVQIVENDQPIKILDSLVFSDRASLNLELKKFTSTGTGKVGTGLSPALWDVNLTPMTFGKTFQMLNSFQSNNIGHDVAKDLRSFYTGGYSFGGNNSTKEGPSYISVRSVASPSFDQKRWLDNKIFLFSTNVLQKLKSGIELKGNVSYYDDTRKTRGYSNTQYFTSSEVIQNREAVDNSSRIHALDAGLLIEKNEKQIYLRNMFKYHKRWNSDRGHLLFNEDTPIAQRRQYTDEALLNTLSLARLFGKQLVNISSSIEWHRTPQQLSVSPGQFSDILNGGKPYEQMSQYVRYNDFNWTNSIGFMRKFKGWTFAPKLALDYLGSSLDTYIDKRDQGHTETLQDGFINDMDNSRLRLGPSIRIDWENNKWKFHANLPYDIYYFNVTQQGDKTLDRAIRHTFVPSTGLTYLLNSNHDISSNFSAGRSFGGLDNFYNGYIISQYRNMQHYDARLLRTDQINAGMGYNYKNTLKANFANFSYSYANSRRDYIFDTTIDDSGRSTTGIKDLMSAKSRHSLQGGVSRFFSPIKTVVKLNGTSAWAVSDYFLNDNMVKQHTQDNSIRVDIVNNLSEVLSGDYKLSFGRMVNKLAEGNKNKISYNNHQLNLAFYPIANHSLIASNYWYGNNIPGQKSQYFLDATYRHQVKKWRTDIELSAINLLNNDNYIQQFSSSYELVQSYFELRPRQIMLSTRFKF
ncbi:TonB-dependent receptor [Sphingobacterium sp. xlx-130]|uniref:TonB-dependent receptor n=1 Tax=Sphingobacterium sp. xlx-130 TaxID=2654323 RepID=UPI0013DD5D92|nr:TonB-dependent receptor [Sphingobacterium sp. xlx-130]